MLKRNFHKVLGALCGLLLAGCLQNGSTSSSSEAPNEKDVNPSAVGNVIFEDGGFTIRGVALQKVKSVRLIGGDAPVELKLVANSKQEMRAVSTSALSLLLGTAYSLLISSAHADVVVPITIQVPPGYTSPSHLSSANATSGQVLKWNGSAWVPSPDYVGAPTSSGLLFMGYSPAYTGNLGGLKGANEKCHQAFPGSHWASVDEITKLGPEYPWTYDVWVKDLAGKDFSAYEGLHATPGSRKDSCFGWTREVNPSTGAAFPVWDSSSGNILKQSGIEMQASCQLEVRLACVK